MSLLDNLLKADVEKLTEKPHKKYEIKRLSQKMNIKFELELTALKPERYAEIQRMSVEIGKKGGIRDVNIFEPKILTLLDGIKEPNLKDQKLLNHFNVLTPKELILKLFLSGEIDDIKEEINILSGYEKDEEEVDEEIKN
ncbi:hypothetical protein [Pelosinus sp. IPA-1]|uniref:phage tail assembly chaperone n=1 Tax=Pelosinus sp. IPA-1 TaxID=3029569 RepID=UPI0024361D2B|nr:hypothetical protein [Pelosinus sp. IPA-1]GMB01075.1 hypothetical protein PIPA1_38740 [Pelosinus sp. IPA-1]